MKSFDIYFFAIKKNQFSYVYSLTRILQETAASNAIQRKDSNSSLSSTSSGPASSTCSSIQHDNDLYNTHKGFITAFHRKMVRELI